MKQRPSLFFFLVGLFFLSFSYPIKYDEIKDYLNIPGPLTFNKTDYNLAWSSHPTVNYYKQEYLPKGDDIDNFKKLMIIDVIISDSLNLQNIMLSKIAELEEMKKSDPVVNYKMFNNPEKTEYIIDFVESQGTESALHIVEWNAYRYKIFTDKSGKKGVILLGISLRAYDNKIKDFFGWLKDGRLKNINKLIEFNIPEVTIAKN